MWGRVLVVATKGPVDTRLFESVVSRERLLRSERMRFPEDRIGSLSAAVLARWMLHGALSLANEDIEFAVEDRGKPYCTQLQRAGTSFSISHTRGWVACGICAGSIGVDIETLRRVGVSDVSPYLHGAELARLEDGCDCSACDCSAVLRLWTIREAYVKYLGTGLSEPPNSFEVVATPQPGIKGAEVVQDTLTVLSDQRDDVVFAPVADSGVQVEYRTLGDLEQAVRLAQEQGAFR